MSELVRNNDVEDVLSSIRRLVVDRPVAEGDAPPRPAKNKNALFLTSAHRVNDPATEPEQIDLEDLDPATDLAHFRNAVGLTKPVAATEVEEFPGPNGAAAQDASDGKSDARRLHLSDVAVAWSDAPPDDYYEDEETDATLVPSDGTTWAVDIENDTLKALPGTTEVVPDTAEPFDFKEPEISELDKPFEFVEQVDTPQEVHDIGTEAQGERDVVAMDDTQSHTTTPPDETPAGHTDQPAAEAIATDMSGHDVKAEGEVEPAVISPAAVPDAPHRPASAKPTDPAEALSNAIMDDDALRELVRAIVREELGGALGERITRNVRKLVRREVNQALITRDLD